ncbi:MAG: 4-hydroxy-tetrahydrodipicolinate synthase [Candidatus Asgardarchaeia archaeon]
MKKIKFDGLMPAIITPMNKDGEVNYEGLKKNVEFYINSGCTGIVANGSTGEAVNLSREERINIVKLIVKIAKGKVKVISGTGAPTTNVTLQYTKDAMDAGADAALVITPFYAIPNKEGLYLHYKKIAEVGIPIIIYNLPQATGVEIDFDTTERLVKLDNIVGIKDSSGNLSYFSEVFRRFSKDITPISGCDDLILQTLSLGTPALILALGNIAPRMIIDIFNAIKSNNLTSARETYFKLLPIARAFNDAVNFPAPVKEAVRLLGRPSGPPRLSILPVTKEESKEITQRLIYAGLLK